MGEINESFHTKDFERMHALINDTKKTFREGRHKSIQDMWDDVFAAYERASPSR